MRQLILYFLLLFFATLAFGSCTNDETDEGLETLTPNEPTETTAGNAIQLKDSITGN